MPISKLFLASALLVYFTSGEARVRELIMDEKSMVSITLKMGQSTILRFKEKPKKVIIGNKNYFNIEFVDNDITLQPLGIIATNLFVYGENAIYGIKLNVVSGGDYDDLLIFVEKTLTTLEPKKYKEYSLENFFYLERFKVYVVDVCYFYEQVSTVAGAVKSSIKNIYQFLGHNGLGTASFVFRLFRS